uniref:Uncharacterized protein n=1 Tax=Anguilla anguilla TaxID=7936 RepID=A0A0E9T1C0_ANGAN
MRSGTEFFKILQHHKITQIINVLTLVETHQRSNKDIDSRANSTYVDYLLS